MCVRSGVFSALVFLCLMACGDVEDPSLGEFYSDGDGANHIEENRFSLVDGTPDAVGVLAFVNDEATSVNTLDIDAKLDIRAARGIIHHRNGPDGVYGTRDDELFKTIAQLDAVKWVGGRAIGRLVAFSQNRGWVPSFNEHLGNYDGVAFTVAEAELTVEFVNESTFEELDALLNRRAAQSLSDSAPFASIHEVANARYVGRSALSMLKTTAGEPVQFQK